MENIGILDAGIVALLGYGVVFFGIILLMVVVMIMGKIFVAAENKKGTIPRMYFHAPLTRETRKPK